MGLVPIQFLKSYINSNTLLDSGLFVKVWYGRQINGLAKMEA